VPSFRWYQAHVKKQVQFQSFKKLCENTKCEVYRRTNSYCVWKRQNETFLHFAHKIKYIVNVFLCYNFHENLLLIGQMIVDKGNTMVFDINKCLILQNQNTKFIVLKGVKDCNNGVYKLKIHSLKSFQEMEACEIK
jgi:hypothetical protein